MRRKRFLRRREFEFHTELAVAVWSGYKADSIETLLGGLNEVPGSSIFYHVWHALFRRHRHTPEAWMNDFARWALHGLGRKTLAEKLACVDMVLLRTRSVAETREHLIKAVREYQGEGEFPGRVAMGDELYFMEMRSFVMPTGIRAGTTGEFVRGLQRLGRNTMLHHFIEGRMRDGGGLDDFSRWFIETGRKDIARQIEVINPLSADLDHLRKRIIEIVRRAG